MIRKSAVLFVLAALVYAANPGTRELCEGFLPENDWKIPVGDVSAKGISQEQFNQVLDRVQEIYAPIVKAKGGTLQINRLWDNPTVNASAQRQGSTYIINMYGGLARHQAITQDGFALVACHEMGHHLGGFPKYSGWSGTWASNEGQSDYFANLKCLRLVFADSGSADFTRADIKDAFAQKACAKSHANEADAAACLRGSLGGMSVSVLFKELRREPNMPSFATPDPKVVATTDDRHPGTQCRLDTYFQGSVCAKPVAEGVDDTNAVPGTCTASGGFSVGLRPLCWYKPAAGAALYSVVPDVSGLKAKSAALRTLEAPAWQ